MEKRPFLQAVVGVAFAFGAQGAYADTTYSYTFDELTSCTTAGACNTQLGIAPWGSLTFTDTATAGTVRMTFAMENLATHADPDLTVIGYNSHLFFNFAGTQSQLNGLSFSLVSGSVGGAVAKGLENFTNGSQGKYDIDIAYGGDALNPNEASAYDITGAGLTASMFNALSSGTGNHYYAGIQLIQDNISPGLDARIAAHSVAAIPEPQTYAMMLAGLGLMGFVARRRK